MIRGIVGQLLLIIAAASSAHAVDFHSPTAGKYTLQEKCLDRSIEIDWAWESHGWQARLTEFRVRSNSELMTSEAESAAIIHDFNGWEGELRPGQMSVTCTPDGFVVQIQAVGNYPAQSEKARFFVRFPEMSGDGAQKLMWHDEAKQKIVAASDAKK
jgi:hypothetical protein